MMSGQNWARRYGTQSPRLCARPGCSSPAAATLRFHSTRREARIVDLDDGAARSGDLCARHVRGVGLPRGWRLCDDRDPEPAVSPEPVAADLAALLDARTPLLQRAFRNAQPL